jgi:hypothetical protein
MRRIVGMMGLLVVWSLIKTSNAAAFIMINEFLADPPTVEGDANLDGKISTTEDEFVELFNTGNEPVNLTGWKLYDSVQMRHLFPSGSIIASRSFLVIFGGGNPALSGITAQTASTKTLSLNNTSDRITLYDLNGTIVDDVTYGANANNDQSLNRRLDGEDVDFVSHLNLSADGKRFSPGTAVDGRTELSLTVSGNSTIVPDVPTFISFFMGILPLSAFIKGRK